MESVLLSTKLRIPPPRSGLVRRERLMHKLDDGLAHKLTIVSASPGYGKTTLVSEWANRAEIPIAWVTLNAADNDIGRFLGCLIAALRKAIPDLTDPLIFLPQTSHASPVEIVLGLLINDLARISDHIALVIDDYQLIENRQIHQAMTQLLENMPSTMHVYIITRADPPFPVARMRARDQLTEIRVADLRFSSSEAAQFLNHTMRLDLTMYELGELTRRTEGWATGLQLAGLSLQSSKHPAHFISDFTGSHEYIADYLVDEVLRYQTEPVKEFLLTTSVLERLSGPLCDAVTGQKYSQEMLEWLRSSNMFVSELDAYREWYSYHRLLSDLLRQRLREAHRDRIPKLHDKAASWYQQNGYPEDAIHHLLLAGQLEEAADQIAEIAEATLMKSQAATLLEWVDQLTDRQIRSRPSLFVAYTWALWLSDFSLDTVKEHLQQLETIDTVRNLPLRAYIALFQGDARSAYVLATKALGLLTENERFLRTTTSWVLDMSGAVESDLQEGVRRVEQAVESSQSSGNLAVNVTTLCHLAELRMRQGRLREAHTIYERALVIGNHETASTPPIAGMAMIGLATIYREWHQLRKAEEYAQRGLGLLRKWSQTAVIDGYLALAFIRVSQGGLLEAQTLLQQASELALQSDATDLDDQIVGLLQARVSILQGDLDSATRMVFELGIDPEDAQLEFDDSLPRINYHILHHQYLILVRLKMAQHRYAEAIKLLDQLEPELDRYGWRPSRREMELDLLKALALQSVGQVDKALIWIEKALAMAETGAYIATFVDEGPAMYKLLDRAFKRSIHPEHVKKILDVFPPSEEVIQTVDALTEREVEVLRLLASGLTNPQIAEHLVVALGTVKAHTSGIYSKLGVGNRVQAVARARELGLL